MYPSISVYIRTFSCEVEGVLPLLAVDRSVKLGSKYTVGGFIGEDTPSTSSPY